MEVKVKCPVCGKIGTIEIIKSEGKYYFIEYDPPMKCAKFRCDDCGLTMSSKWEEDLSSPDLLLIGEVRNKLELGSYSQETIERVGKFCLLHLENNSSNSEQLEWSEIEHRLKTLENLIYDNMRKRW